MEVEIKLYFIKNKLDEEEDIYKVRYAFERLWQDIELCFCEEAKKKYKKEYDLYFQWKLSQLKFHKLCIFINLYENKLLRIKWKLSNYQDFDFNYTFFRKAGGTYEDILKSQLSRGRNEVLSTNINYSLFNFFKILYYNCISRDDYLILCDKLINYLS